MSTDLDEPVRPRAPGERITEIGDWERIDRARHPWAAAVALAVLVGIFTFTAIGLGSAVREGDRRVDIPDVEVPSIDGVAEDDARAALEAIGLIMVVEETPNEVVPLGVVYDQQPVAGAKIELGSPVTARVSAGPAGTVVPDTVGQQSTEATTLLRTVGLGAELVATFDELVRPGEVLSSSPAPGERATPGATVRLAVSNGPAPRTVPTVTDAQGAPRNQLDVLGELGRVGLRPGDITAQVDASLPVGSVLSISPPAGTQVARGTEVDLVVVGEPDPVTVPWITGLAEQTAFDALEDAGLSASVRTVPLVAGDPASGRVVRQGIPGGSAVPSGMSMDVVVGVAPPPPTTVPPTAAAPAPATTAPPG